MKANTLPLLIILLGSGFLSLSSSAAEPNITAAVKQLRETGQCPACILRGANLAGMDLSGANLAGADISGANLTQTNLRGANLQGATMLGLALSETMLSGANLKNADMSDLDIDEVFEYVEIIGTQFEGARFKDNVVCGPAPFKGGWGCQQL